MPYSLIIYQKNNFINMKRFNITESDRNEILDLHRKAMINEAEVSTGVQVPVSTAELVGGKTVVNAPAAQTTNYTIIQLQDLLNQRGYNLGKADGYLGKNSLAQIQAALTAAKTSQANLAQQQAAQAVTTTTTTISPVAGLPVPPAQQSNEPEIKIPKPFVSGQVTDKFGTNPLQLK
jgi:phage-related protein